MRTGVAIALLAGASFAAHSAGLGKLTVNSSLGQILAAEIDLVSVQVGELDTLSARVASPESYRDAKIEYSSVLRLLRFSVEKRASGHPYLKLTSIAPINEPFVDMLIEVTWPAGRLQREYPILLDPPGFSDARATAPVAAARPAQPAAPAPAAASAAAAPMPAPAGSPSAKTEMAAAAPALVKEPGKDTYGPVEKGETLRKIAGEVKPSEVSMEQMLAALYRENKAAFIDSNMNRLKAGQILRVPSAEEVSKISGKEANQEVRTHVSNWKSYREGLAGGVASMPARSESARAATGQVGTAAVSPPPAPAAESGDVLKLSKTDGAKGGAAGKSGAAQDRLNALQEELTAKDKSLRESQSRVSELEKQIRDMQRLVDLKGGAPVKPGEPAKAPDTKVAAAKPAEPAKPAEAPKADTKPAEPAKPAEAPKADAKPAEPAKPAEAPKPADAAKPAPAKSAAAKKPAPPPEPDLMDQAMDNLPIIVGGAGLLGAVGFVAMFIRRRRQKAEAGPTSSMTSGFPSDLKPSTGTGKAGGGLVDTGNSSFLTDFDKTGPGMIDTDEVDPVAEAEVYIAYGRDAQAEEILKEAMSRDKNRHEIPLKLLEIYHARKSATAFETVAKELRGAVGDSSPIWQKAAAMGAQIDPTNPLYGGAAGAPTAAVAFEAAAPAPKPDLDFDLDSAPSASPAPAAAESPGSFDLDLGTEQAPQPDLPVANDVPALDFDLAPPAAPALDMPLSADAPKDEKSAFDFDLSGLDFPSGSPSGTSAAAAPDLNLSGDTPSANAQTASLNLTDLDLGEGGDAGGGDGVTTKLELAKAYLEIGDKDGAREILQEVAKEGSAAQKAEAQNLIASL
ncbi:MAG: FimV family protein [Betaproteobacteria bacterium]|nr:FimV family protein [Betaproteobacteria bacterium]